MSIKGSDYKWFRDALKRRHLPLVKATAAELPGVNLEDALEVALLVCDHEPENAERAAVRWLRKFLERPGVTLADLRQALDAFAVLVEEPDSAEATLAQLAKRH